MTEHNRALPGDSWLRQAISGAGASALARTIVSPLDVLKIRLQLMTPSERGAKSTSSRSLLGAGRQLMAEEGIRAFFRGNTAGLALYAAYGWVQFPVYSFVTSYGQHGGAPSMFGAGCLAGAAATIATYPLDLARTRLAIQGVPRLHRHAWDVLKHAYTSRGGFTGLFIGLGPTLVQIVPAAGTTFLFYEWFHKLGRSFLLKGELPGVPPQSENSALGSESSRKLREDAPGAAAAIVSVAGMLSGACSKLLVLPLDTVRRRLQASGAAAADPRIDTAARSSGAAEVARAIVRAEGVAGLWRGATPALLKAGLGSWATFAGYELMQAFLPPGR